MAKFFGAPKKQTPRRGEASGQDVVSPSGTPGPMLLADTVVGRQHSKFEEEMLKKLMNGALSVQRTYLATTEPLPVHRLMERVALPIEDVIAAIKELVSCGLLMIVDSPTSNGGVGPAAEMTFTDLVRSKPGSFEQAWSKALATPPEAIYDQSAGGDDATSQRMHQTTAQLMNALQHLVMQYGEQFNRAAVDKELHIYCTNLGEVVDRLPKPDGRGTFETKLIRWRASTSLWSLSVRARRGLVEFFLISAADAMSLGTAEHEMQALGRLELAKRGDDLIWLSDGLPVSADDVRGLVRSCMRELIRSSVNELLNNDHWAAPGQQMSESVAQLHARQAAMEKQNLAQKIVSQQEEIQRRIARDLHDAVIADVTLLKRSISSDKAINRDLVVSSLDQIAGRLREICYDLSPSDLKDWGLHTTLEALLEQVGQRCGAQCNLICDMDIPPLESSVELHVFRIVQEALNNCAKYAGASQINAVVKITGGWLQFIVEDNGRGFESADHISVRTKDGGMGMSSMQERVELIRTLYPARLQVFSQPGQGTKTALSIKIPT